MVSFINPHHPFNPPVPWHKKYNPNNLSLLSGWTKKCIKRDLQKNKGYFPNENLTKSKMKKIMAYYYASISLIDHQIGKFIELLKEKGLYDNTLIVFTSDHGDYMGFHHMILKANYMYDPIMKVPLIIKYPYQKDKGVSSQKLVSNIDVATTILKQTDCEIGGDMSGYDLTTEKERDYIFAESGSDKNSELDSYMIRSHKYKLLINKDYKTLFFDLEEDPNEINNLINDPNYKKIINKFKDRLYRWFLFEAIPPLYINENEKIISKTNVSSLKDEEHNLRKNYFRKKMKKE
jgi:arylsulfatase A-like enzyme